MSLSPSKSIETSVRIPQGVCTLSYTPLDVQQIIKSVQHGSAGGTAVFIGTTRNSFKGKVVTRLEYQAYSKLAIKTMADIMLEAAASIARSDRYTPSQGVPSLVQCAIYHRLGTVAVGEPSIVIAVSSPHRKEAFVACESILEGVKRKAQIWKREYYEGEQEDEAEWKANE